MTTAAVDIKPSLRLCLSTYGRVPFRAESVESGTCLLHCHEGVSSFMGLWRPLAGTASSFVVVEIKNQQQKLLLIKLRFARNKVLMDFCGSPFCGCAFQQVKREKERDSSRLSQILKAEAVEECRF